jgi:hypothetical protein
VLTSRSAHHLALKLGVPCPIISGIYRVIHGGRAFLPPGRLAAWCQLPGFSPRAALAKRSAAPACTSGAHNTHTHPLIVLQWPDLLAWPACWHAQRARTRGAWRATAC